VDSGIGRRLFDDRVEQGTDDRHRGGQV